MKKILVTGGCGYIGSHTCVSLIEQGYQPIVIDNLLNSKAAVLQRIKLLTGVKPLFYPGDLRNNGLLNQIFDEHEISSVIHFAGLKGVGESVTIPLEYYDNNIGGTLSLVKAMAQAKVNSLIFSSSATVYGEAAPVPYHESLPLGIPSSPYGRTKVMIERMLMDIATQYPNWSITLLRYFNPVGAHPSGTMGEDPQGVPNNLVPYIAQVAVGRRPYLVVFGDDYPTPDKTCIRDYIHVMDLAEGHVSALAHKEQIPGLHCYNLGSGQGHSVLEVIAAFSQACGKTVPYQYAARREGDLAMFWADAMKAKHDLDWQTTRSLQEMMSDTWRWQHNNPYGYSDD